MESNLEENTVEVKRGRGRPRKEKIVSDEPTQPKKRGRPKKPIIVSEIRQKQKPGPKTDMTKQDGYYKQFYREHYQGVFVTCPMCGNPNVNASKVHRHIKTSKCTQDDLSNKYHKNETV
jgi:hypothetical protein